MGLHFVALGKNISLAQWLLDNGAIFSSNETNETALHWACKSGYLPMVKLLFHNMTNYEVVQKDIDGLSALDWAEENENYLVVQFLATRWNNALTKVILSPKLVCKCAFASLKKKFTKP